MLDSTLGPQRCAEESGAAPTWGSPPSGGGGGEEHKDGSESHSVLGSCSTTGGHVALGHSHILSGPQFPHLLNDITATTPYVTG